MTGLDTARHLPNLPQKGAAMAEEYPKQGGGVPSKDELVQIRERLREGRLERDDIEALERIVANVEEASAALRAAIVE
jgi:hypothetical protein